MVVRESKTAGRDQPAALSQWTSTTTMMMTEADYDEDSSCSSDPQRMDDSQRKRSGNDADDEKELKRRKNREAAKRCRDKKQQQTEDLKRRNGELERDNCQLAKQRDELIRKCQAYQQEIEQHKEQGCMVPHFNPPYNLDQILQPGSPPSPSFSESAPSTSSCASPAPSISPGPPTRHAQPTCTHLPPQTPAQDVTSSDNVNNKLQNGVRGANQSKVTSDAIPTTVTTLAPAQSTQPNPEAQQRHYLRVRNKDGTHKILCLDHENYLKVMQRLKAQRAAAAQNAEGQGIQASTSTSSASPMTQSQIRPQAHPESQNNMKTNTGIVQHPFIHPQVEEQEGNPRPGQKLDTCEDLITILKSHVKDTGNGFQLVPVEPDDVYVKQEPVDTDYEQKNFPPLDNQSGLMGVKQEDVMVSDSTGVWTSTGEHIRQGLELLTNKDDLSSDSARIQNIVQYLKTDEDMAPDTMTIASTEHLKGQPARQNVTISISSTRPPQMATYITSSSPLGSLHKVNAGGEQISTQQATTHAINKQQNTAEDHKQKPTTFIPSMETVKLRACAANLGTSASTMLRGQLQTAASQSQVQHSTAQLAPVMTAVQNSRINRTASANKTAETKLQPIPITSLNTGSVQTSQSMTSFPQNTSSNMNIELTSEQQLSVAPSVSALHPHSRMTFQEPPPSSTIDASALASMQLHAVTSNENLKSVSTSQIEEYLLVNSIETMDS